MHNTLLADERSVIADLSWLSEGYAQKSFAAQAPAAELGGQHTAGEEEDEEQQVCEAHDAEPAAPRASEH